MIEGKNTLQTRYLAITPGALLIFDVKERRARLIMWSTIQSLSRIRKNTDDSSLITFIFRPSENTKQAVHLTLISEDRETICNLITKNLALFGVLA